MVTVFRTPNALILWFWVPNVGVTWMESG